jgi:ribosomal protein S11
VDSGVQEEEHPFAAQTAAGNAIRAVVDQGMQRAVF